VTLYPVDRILQTLGDGRGVGTLADERDEEYFNPTDGVDPDVKVYRQVAYRQTYSHPDPKRPETFQLDANAAKQNVAGWIGHRINDGATLSAHSTSDEELRDYYQRSAETRNVCAVTLCVPLLGFVTTRAVAEGDELFATYGHGYWLQRQVPVSEEVDEAVMEPAKETVLWQVATDKKYAKGIRALDDFISKATPDDVAAVASDLKDGGGGKAVADAVPRNRTQRRAAAKVKATPDAKSKAGFGGMSVGSGGSKVKAKKSKRR